MATPTTVILGAGIIGVSTAYYLSLTSPPSSIYLVEVTPTLFGSASGFAGGFISRDWFADDIAALGRLSFEEHGKLAREFGGRERWGYGPSTGVSYTVGRPRVKGRRGDDWLRGGSRADVASEAVVMEGKGPGWLRREEGDGVEIISEVGSLAQVDPLRLCRFLLAACLERGVTLHQPATAVSVARDAQGSFSSIKVLNTATNIERTIPCSNLLIAAGAWSPIVFSTLFPSAPAKLPVSKLAGHSLVLRSPKWLADHESAGAHAVFSTDEDGFCPEIFSRFGGEIYVAGLNSSTIPLPPLATDSKVDETQIAKLLHTTTRLLGPATELEILRTALCFRPVTERGTPIVARIPESMLGESEMKGKRGGVWLAAGHGPWGISHSLGTGKVMAELIEGKAPSVDISGLGFEGLVELAI